MFGLDKQILVCAVSECVHALIPYERNFKSTVKLLNGIRYLSDFCHGHTAHPVTCQYILIPFDTVPLSSEAAMWWISFPTGALNKKLQLFIKSILPRDEHLRQAALDAEVQAKVAQQELEEDCQAGMNNSDRIPL